MGTWQWLSDGGSSLILLSALCPWPIRAPRDSREWKGSRQQPAWRRSPWWGATGQQAWEEDCVQAEGMHPILMTWTLAPCPALTTWTLGENSAVHTYPAWDALPVWPSYTCTLPNSLTIHLPAPLCTMVYLCCWQIASFKMKIWAYNLLSIARARSSQNEPHPIGPASPTVHKLLQLPLAPVSFSHTLLPSATLAGSQGHQSTALQPSASPQSLSWKHWDVYFLHYSLWVLQAPKTSCAFSYLILNNVLRLFLLSLLYRWENGGPRKQVTCRAAFLQDLWASLFSLSPSNYDLSYVWH